MQNIKNSTIEKIDAKVGPQGPPGATGATGSQGLPGSPELQGPPGITDINGSNYYSIIGNPSSPTFEDLIANSTAVCLPGDVALSGDYNITGAIRETPGITYFGSLGSDPPTNWSTQAVGFLILLLLQNCKLF